MHKKINAIAFFLAFLFCKLSFAQSILDNTTWRGVDNERDQQITFLPNGVGRYTLHNGAQFVTYENMKWSLNGSDLYMEINNKFVEKNAKIIGVKFSGSAVNKPGKTWTFEYSKIDLSSAPNFEQVARKFNVQTGKSEVNQAAAKLDGKSEAEPAIAKSNETKNNPASISESAQKFTFIPKLGARDIKYLFIDRVWKKEDFDGFLFNYSFIHRIYYKLRTNGGAYEYLEAPHRQAFMPLMGVIEKDMRGMDSVVANIARGLNVQPQLVYSAFGLELDEGGTLNENKIEKIGNGRLRADDYWMRHPGNARSVNEWYDARDPKVLFGSFYPQYISEYISDIPKIIALAKNYEDEQAQAAQKREERQRWLQTAEGKKFLADEEAKMKKEESDRIKAEAAENARIAKEFPYVARFTCTTNGYPVNFISCLYGRVNTEIEIQNGQEYKLYQGAEFSNKFPDDKGAKVVNLRSKFSITAQNAAENLILGVKILDRKTGATVFEKQASQFRAIKVSN